MYELILVSQSPRRRELLTNSGFKFQHDTVKVSEIIDENLNLDEAIIKIARQKAQAYIDSHNSLKSQRVLLLSADTLVVFKEQVLGKPKNKNQAREFLSLLSGETHSVKTGLCVYDFYSGKFISGLETTKITFKKLSDQDITDYINSGEPMDKAGAYGIQGAGGKFVASREGDYENVVGLPINLFKKIVSDNGWKIRS
jgi:septum formation protein